MNVQKEDATLVRRVWRAHDGRLPMEEIIANRSGRALSRRIAANILQFLINSLQCHFL
jgi:hypothetical protein